MGSIKKSWQWKRLWPEKKTLTFFQMGYLCERVSSGKKKSIIGLDGWCLTGTEVQIWRDNKLDVTRTHLHKTMAASWRLIFQRLDFIFDLSWGAPVLHTIRSAPPHFLSSSLSLSSLFFLSFWKLLPSSFFFIYSSNFFRISYFRLNRFNLIR